MKLTYELVLQLLDTSTPFAFSRFGDGEFHCIFGSYGRNVDGVAYAPDLGKALRHVLESVPRYPIGIQPMARRLFCRHAAYGAEFLKLVAPYETDADLLHRASIQGKFESFFQVLKKRRVCLVGPEGLHASTLVHWLLPDARIFVSCQNAWEQVEEIEDRCQDEFQRNADTVFLFCAGMASKPLIHNMWGACGKGTWIDCGSVLDPYAGRFTRKYHHKLKLPLPHS